jgi:hypothetical protein
LASASGIAPSIVLGDDENDAVVDPRSADLPRLGDADRILLDGLGLGCGQHQHRDLAALGALEVAQPRIEALDLRSRERSGEIGNARLQRRHRDFRRRGQREQQRSAGCDRSEPASQHRSYFLPKSTVGGFAMAFSSSTTKLGLV